ncbi:exonuclease SbcCD subunit D [Sphingobacterium sp. SGR-19]|uniref:metallophosphoesterase family protein n=1 Tax=Sphingobacterium sp. SGR-19 TaxID=2710886 RepID=UPI0013EBB906|nr:exonuclease subunit SbcD [Sphingobacterium sp. SGR-19]NGM65183.1 exonuclease subunit SbcD [Sphingobacterium sp. SGR-19]
MKILHTSDWHLGKRLDYFSRLEEQRAVLTEICEIADEESVDAVIVAGDLFDAFNPPVEAVELLYKTLRQLSREGQRPVIAIAGNHDSADRIDAPDVLARECGIIFIGYPQATIQPFHTKNGFSIHATTTGFLEISLSRYNYPLRIIHTPFANELRLKQFLGLDDKAQQLNELLRKHWLTIGNMYCDNQGVNLLTTHLYMLQRGGEISEEPEGEKPIKVGHADLVYSDAIPPQIQYTALGHLHRFQNIGDENRPVVYPSSPLAYSFSEAGQAKGVVIVDVVPEQPAQYQFVPLSSGKKLHRKQFKDIDAAVLWLNENPDTLVELTLMTDTFLSSADMKRIHEAHDGIIHIIPVVQQTTINQTHIQSVNLDQNIDVLFKDYFQHRLGQEPNGELMDLLNEVIHCETETED